MDKVYVILDYCDCQEGCNAQTLYSSDFYKNRAVAEQIVSTLGYGHVVLELTLQTDNHSFLRNRALSKLTPEERKALGF